jgi:hypothetical protein
MKKFLFFLVAAAVAGFLLVSCEKDEVFDESLLVGRWRSGTLYYKYLANGTGSTWDEKDDVREEEAQHFTWTLQGASLTHFHIMEIGGSSVPKYYTVTELTSGTLRYRDVFFKSFSFTRVD